MTNIEGDATVKRGNGGKHAGTESIRAHTHSSMPLMRIGILISQSRILFLLFFGPSPKKESYTEILLANAK